MLGKGIRALEIGRGRWHWEFGWVGRVVDGVRVGWVADGGFACSGAVGGEWVGGGERWVMGFYFEFLYSIHIYSFFKFFFRKPVIQVISHFVYQWKIHLLVVLFMVNQ